MKPTQKYTFTIGANGVYRLLVAGDFFKVLSATGAVGVKGDFGELRSLVTGQGLKNANFKDLVFNDESAAPNTVTVLVGDQDFIDGVTGDVRVTTAPAVVIGTNKVAQATFGNTNVTVTNASTQIDAANAARQYLLIQNKSTTGTVYLAFGGAATVANGLAVPPGGSWESNGVAPTNAVFAIGSIASNPDVVIVEG